MKDLMITNNDLIMSSYDFLNEVINPARISAGENPVKNTHFVARVEDEIDDLGAVKNFNRFGNTVKYYDLTIEQMTLVGMRESKAVRRKVLETLKKLSKENSIQLPNFNDPAESARAWADQYEARREAEKKLIEAKPAVDFVDKYVDSEQLFSFRQVCKLLGAKEPDFREFLKENKIMYLLGSNWTAYANHLDAGRFKVKTGINMKTGISFNTAYFTAKGVEWVAGVWATSQLKLSTADLFS